MARNSFTYTQDYTEVKMPEFIEIDGSDIPAWESTNGKFEIQEEDGTFTLIDIDAFTVSYHVTKSEAVAAANKATLAA